MSMRALVTGGTGHVGTFLTDALLERGYTVTLFDYAEGSVRDDERVSFIKGDLADELGVYRAVVESRATDIFHLGAMIGASCDRNPLYAWKVNFRSTNVLLEAMLSLGISRFFMLSSLAVFGVEAGDPAADDAPRNPPNIYGQTKLASEHLLRWYAEKHGLDARALRFPRTFGPRRRNGFTAIYSQMLDGIARGEEVDVIDPDSRGSWLYIRNAVQAILDYHSAPDPGRRVYNIGAPVMTAREFALRALEICPGAKLRFVQRNVQNEMPYPRGLDDTCAREDWGWNPRYDLDSAIREHIAMQTA